MSNNLDKSYYAFGENISYRKIGEYPVHQLIRLGRLELYISHSGFSNSNFDLKILVQVIVLSLLAYPYFERDIEQDEMRKRRSSKKKLNKFNDFASFC